jgi:hypothetical protein
MMAKAAGISVSSVQRIWRAHGLRPHKIEQFKLSTDLRLSTNCVTWSVNAVEDFFAKLSRRRLKRGVFRSVVDLQVATNRFVNETNQMPKPFTWTADPDKIIATAKRGIKC